MNTIPIRGAVVHLQCERHVARRDGSVGCEDKEDPHHVDHVGDVGHEAFDDGLTGVGLGMDRYGTTGRG